MTSEQSRNQRDLINRPICPDELKIVEEDAKMFGEELSPHLGEAMCMAPCKGPTREGIKLGPVTLSIPVGRPICGRVCELGE